MVLRIASVLLVTIAHLELTLKGQVYFALPFYLLAGILLWLGTRPTPGAPVPAPVHLSQLHSLPAGIALGLALTSFLLARAGQHWPQAVMLWLAGIACALIAAGGIPDPRRWRVPSLRQLVSWESAALLAILALALVVRVYRLDLYPNGLHGDEGVNGLESLAILEGTGRKFFDSGHWSVPAASFYLYAFSQLIAGYGQEGIRIASALSGVILVLGMYLLGRTLFGSRTGLLAAFLTAVASSQIHYSRMVLHEIEVAALVTLALAALWFGLREGKPFVLTLAGVVAGFSFYFSFAPQAMVPVIGLFFLAVAISTRSFRDTVNRGLMFLLGFVATVVPLANAYHHTFGHSQGRLLLSNPEIVRGSFQTDNLLLAHWQNLHRNLQGMFVTIPFDGFSQNDLPMILSLTGALVILGFVYAVLKIRDLRFLLLVIWFVVVFTITGVMTTHSPQGHRLIHSVAPALLLAAVALDRTIAALPGYVRRRSWRMLAAAPLVALLAIIAITNLRAFFLHGDQRVMWESVSVQARYHQELSKHYFVVQASSPLVDLNHPSLRFLNRNLQGIDLHRPLNLAQVPADGRPIAFVVYQHRIDDLTQIKQRFPNGAEYRVILPRPQQTPIFTVYTTVGEPPPYVPPVPDPLIRALLDPFGP